MRIEIIMPKMGESVTEGTIIKWHKKPGDFIKKDEILFEISTDKVDTEIPCEAEGYLSEMLYPEGATIEVGKVVAVVSSEQGSIVTPPTTKPAEVVPAAPVVATQLDAPTPAAESSGNVSGGAMIDIPMPKMGESVMEGTIIKWHKKVGDTVKKDEIIFEISTDKVDTEVPSPVAGVLAEILVVEQQTVAVGVSVAKIADSGSGIRVPAPPPAPASVHDVIGSMVLNEAPAPATEIVTTTQTGNRFYSPLVMNIAKKENVSFAELEGISGSGLGGRVSKKDILRYIENRKTAQPTKTSAVAQTPPVVQTQPAPSVVFQPSPQFEAGIVSGSILQVPMDNIRQKIMQHMVKSRDTSVHVMGMVEVDMGAIYQFLKEKKETIAKNEGVKLTYMSFIAQAAVKALVKYPFVNSSIEGGTILQKRFVNLGIAVALEPNGLIVPNIKNAQDKNILGLAKSINDLAERARTKKLAPDDISGGTFTITNYGVFGTLLGTPIINQPEVAILGIGSVVKRPVVIEVNGQDVIAIKPMMYLTLSHDHRLVDGMLGGKFLKEMKEVLEGFNANLI